MPTTLTGKVAYNTALQIVGRFINLVISLVTIGLLARYLGVEGFGLYTVILTFVGLVGILGDLGLSTQLVKELTRPGADQKSITAEFVGIRAASATLVSLVGFIVAWILYGQINPYPAVVIQGIGIGLIGIWFNQLAAILTSVLQIRLKLYLISVADVLARIGQFLAILYLVSISADLIVIVTTFVLSNTIYLAAVYFFARGEMPIGFGQNFSYWGNQLKLALPLSVITILGTVHYRLDLVLLSLLKDSAAVAIYGLPYRIIDVLILLPGSFIAAVFPVFASFSQTGEDVRSGYQKSFDLLAFFTMPAVVGLIVLAKPIMDLIGGGAFVDSPQLLQILGLSLVASFLTSVGRALLISKDLQKMVLLAFVGVVFLNATLNLLLIPRYSYFGAAWATLSSEGLLFIIEMFLIYKFLSIWPMWSVTFKAVLASLAMGGVILWLQNFGAPLYLLIPAGTLVYLAMMYMIGGLTREMVRSVLK